MQSKVPVPTDNIFKFYALFGLLLFIATAFMFVQSHQNYNDKAFDRYIELQALKNIETLSKEQEAKRFILEAQKDIDTSDKKFFMNIIALFFLISMALMIYGFMSWHKKIQPLQDQISKKSLQKLNYEIELIKAQIKSVRYPKR
ncbi:hypothetical protein [Endozoicomonas arenosclerae]|uniref:hypothetical protein n=1 Tax=Endozoicomonas arenosclerae TaxID=1633495 RepID=UPI000784FC22|nr:hypothetical protein [Endozoicomonas arenosclerae]